MTKIEIPESFIEELHNKEQLKLVEEIASAVQVEYETQAAHVQSPLEIVALPGEVPVDSDFLARCLNNEVERRASDKQLMAKIGPQGMNNFSPAIRRPKVFVREIGNEAYVGSKESMQKMFEKITDIQVEKGYYGPDSRDVAVLRCRLPEGYEVRVPYIKLEHVPEIYTRKDLVVAKVMPSKEGNGGGTLMLLCRELEPVWGDRSLLEISGEVIRKNYNFISVKIRKDDHTMKMWFPGRDVKCAPCRTLGEHYVLIGGHFGPPQYPAYRKA